jgi:plasmid stabilization system protein ParE
MAGYTVVWTDTAYSSLRKVHDFIAEDSPEGAKNVVKELVRLSQSLETLPRRNPIEPSLAEASVEYRFLAKWNFKIIYTILTDDQIVLVVLVFDTRQNPKKLKI